MKYEVTARQLELSTLIDLKTDAKSLLDWLPRAFASLPGKPNTSSANESSELYWIGPDHWLLRSSLDKENEIIEQLSLTCVPENISAVVVSDTLTFFSLYGPQADQVVSIICPLDIHPKVFADNAACYTEAFGLKALLIRRENGFELAVDRSFADMMADVLTRAGAGFE